MLSNCWQHMPSCSLTPKRITHLIEMPQQDAAVQQWRPKVACQPWGAWINSGNISYRRCTNTVHRLPTLVRVEGSWIARSPAADLYTYLVNRNLNFCSLATASALGPTWRQVRTTHNSMIQLLCNDFIIFAIWDAQIINKVPIVQQGQDTNCPSCWLADSV